MRAIVAFVALFSICAETFSQESDRKEDRRISVKIYNLSSYQEPLRASGSPVSLYTPEWHSNAEHLHPTLAVQWSGNGRWSQEVEVTNIYADKRSVSLSEYDPRFNSFFANMYLNITETRIALRYECMRELRPSAAKLIPSIGFAVGPYFTKARSTPLGSYVYPARQTDVGARFFLVPRINWNLTSRFFLDLNVPVCLVEVDLRTEVVRNPSIPARQQHDSDLIGAAFPVYFSGRLGLGVRI